MKTLELLAPARNADIGIAAIDCGADAVYMAGPEFGARKDAGNAIDDVRSVCEHAHLFGARVFMTVNTIVFDGELEEVHAMMLQAQEAGVDAFIVQDLALTAFDDITIPLHASTQCSIRTPERAMQYASAGFSRLVLERELSLEQVKAIADSTEAELEFFVHGALCVCYSGQCYMSQAISGRSANRGECIQACRSQYDLVDEAGHVLVRNKALLSLKDFDLVGRLEDLAEAGVESFKIEGRLKNISYVKNVVSAYSQALDRLVAAHPDLYRRASFGISHPQFTPSLDKTFNRGYTELYLDGRRGEWSSMDAPKGMGEYLGTIRGIRHTARQSVEIGLSPVSRSIVLSNGDGFSVVGRNGIVGFRGDVCEGVSIICKDVKGIHAGDKIYRNVNSEFERQLERPCAREIRVDLQVKFKGSDHIDLCATTEDGRSFTSSFKTDVEAAQNVERELAMVRDQLSKRSLQYIFNVSSVESGGRLPLLSAATLNAMRRCVASDLDTIPVRAIPMRPASAERPFSCPTDISYKDNVANKAARSILSAAGALHIEDAFELSQPSGAELMRTRYCVRHELGMCPVHQDSAVPAGRLYLLNNGRRFALDFHCGTCEMTVSEA